MGILNRSPKGGNRMHEMAEHYVPASLPVPGANLERESPSLQMETYVPADYAINAPGAMDAAYHTLAEKLRGVIGLCDRHTAPDFCKPWVDSQTTTLYTELRQEVPRHTSQVARITGTIAARRQTLQRKRATLESQKRRTQQDSEARQAQLRASIDVANQRLQGHRAQFTVRLLGMDLPLGPLMTLASCVFDACVNFNAYQYLLLSQTLMLVLTVIGMSLLSDVTMSVLAAYVTRREEHFTSKPIYYTVCASMIGLFAVSVLGSILVKVGTMPEMFGTIDSHGRAVPPDHYTLAHWSTTIVLALVPACTGMLVFALSSDRWAQLISQRKADETALAALQRQTDAIIEAQDRKLDAWSNEMQVLDAATPPAVYDAAKQEAAAVKIETIRLGLMLQALTLQILAVNDPSYADELSAYGASLLAAASKDVLSTLQASSFYPDNTICLNKAS